MLNLFSHPVKGPSSSGSRGGWLAAALFHGGLDRCHGCCQPPSGSSLVLLSWLAWDPWPSPCLWLAYLTSLWGHGLVPHCVLPLVHSSGVRLPPTSAGSLGCLVSLCSARAAGSGGGGFLALVPVLVGGAVGGCFIMGPSVAYLLRPPPLPPRPSQWLWPPSCPWVLPPRPLKGGRVAR